MRKWIDAFSAWMVSLGIEAYLHIVCTMVVAMLIARVSLITGADRLLAGYIAVFIGFSLGLFKEMYDNKTTGVFEVGDITANAVGAFLFFIIFI